MSLRGGNKNNIFFLKLYHNIYLQYYKFICNVKWNNVSDRYSTILTVAEISVNLAKITRDQLADLRAWETTRTITHTSRHNDIYEKSTPNHLKHLAPTREQMSLLRKGDCERELNWLPTNARPIWFAIHSKRDENSANWTKWNRTEFELRSPLLLSETSYKTLYQDPCKQYCNTYNNTNLLSVTFLKYWCLFVAYMICFLRKCELLNILSNKKRIERYVE